MINRIVMPHNCLNELFPMGEQSFQSKAINLYTATIHFEFSVEVVSLRVKWSCFLGQFCGSAKMHLVYVHAAFRISAWVKYAVSGVRLSRAV